MKYDNAFIAVGLDREDVVIETLRADFAGILRSWVKNEGYTQSQAGKSMGSSCIHASTSASWCSPTSICRQHAIPT